MSKQTSVTEETSAQVHETEPEDAGAEAVPTGDQSPPPQGGLVPAPSEADLTPAYPEDVYRALSAADERQMAQEIQGNAVSAMLYSFPQGGSRIFGLSWKGVREAIRVINTRGMGRIRIDPSIKPEYEEVTVKVDTGQTDDKNRPKTDERKAIRCTVYAVDEMHGGGQFGTATQLAEMKLNKKDKDGAPIWMPDPFAAAKALSKAERNALEPLIPLELVEELKVLFEGKGAVEYIPGVGREKAPDPLPALTDEKAKALEAEIRELYQEFKRAHPEDWKKDLKDGGMRPADFNRSFIAAQHSHDRLGDFRDHMKQLVKGEGDGGK